MDPKLVEQLIGPSYSRQGFEAIQSRHDAINKLLRHRKIPEEGWDEVQIKLFLDVCPTELSAMDSNNFRGAAGAGEREGRVVCPLVADRHRHLAHGIGRSGDIAAVQPKAAGSSLVNKLANSVALDAIRIAGIKSTKAAFIMPAATGMALLLCLLYFRRLRPRATRVLWSRIDQKTCFKSILTAGCTPVIIEPIIRKTAQKSWCSNDVSSVTAAEESETSSRDRKIDGNNSNNSSGKSEMEKFETEFDGSEQLETDIETFQAKINEFGTEDIVCVISTTSCFAPRAPDDVEALGRLCAAYNIPHLVNNAYGLQSSKLTHFMEQAGATKKRGKKAGGKKKKDAQYQLERNEANHHQSTSSCSSRIDAFVQSTDKNFLVPVGGAVIAGFSEETVEGIAKMYPGRGSGTPSMDVLTTLLWLGARGWRRLLADQKQNYRQLRWEMNQLAAEFGERVMRTRGNPISLAFTLSNQCENINCSIEAGKPFSNDQKEYNSENVDDGRGGLKTNQVKEKDVTRIGSMLFTRHLTGARTVWTGTVKRIEGYEFHGWGSHSSQWNSTGDSSGYLNVAAAIGMKTAGADDEVIQVVQKVRNVLQDVQRFQKREAEGAAKQGKEDKL